MFREMETADLVVNIGGREFPTINQPDAQDTWICTGPYFTIFSQSLYHGTMGLLTHSTTEESEAVLGIRIGNKAALVSPNGGYHDYEGEYKAKQIRRYQATKPGDEYSDFKRLGSNERQLTVAEIHADVYQVGGRLVFQTCFEKNGVYNFGILFAILEKSKQFFLLPLIFGNRK